ncbi:BNR repeat-containing family member [Neorhodopirellula lusitana]|uniref:BNR repeat-containing family member n=1 Tax=Neorhodopirellula lusitana TaxID=445327 RepID=A0ABY1QMN6_9BACT|nr:BNR-4 repeat-containing protein [Neorhodopirellula lusitana]SMP75456.1 BNR repeat-containing family member [Neorhodopirellula lusitana]
MKTPYILPLLLLLTVSGYSDEPASYDREADPHDFSVFMTEGGWCWYQDPRAILHDGKVFIGSVQGTGAGPALVGVYDVDNDQPLGTVTMHPRFDGDDHNSPVFHVCPDGRVLAVYARHNRDRFHHSRYASPATPLEWSDEVRHERVMSNPKDNVTYMNLHEMESEGALYLFFRGINFDPTFVTSKDHGESWSDPVHFFKSEVGGRHRPYARYAGNDKDTVHVAITDAHPRDFGNSIYYFQFRNGSFYTADNKLIKNLANDGPLRPSETELVYQGTNNPGRGPDLSAIGAAWTSSIELDKVGHPHIGYTVYNSNTDHRYRIASWNGSNWIDREVAYGGNCLYDRESSYTGLITLDPVDPSVVLISTDVNPATGEDLGGLHEIYRATIQPTDTVDSIEWTPVTQNSPVRNLRPVILRDHNRRVILWNRGDFKTYTNYQLDTVGIIESVTE